MKRIQLFLIVLIATVVSLITLAIVSWYYAITSPSYYGSSWMGQMWGSHLGTSTNYGMGGMMGNGSTTLTPSYLWIIPVVLGLAVTIAVIGVAFYYAYPELIYIRANTTCNPVSGNSAPQKQTVNPIEKNNPETINQSTSKITGNCDVLLKTMTPDEKKVMDVLVAHQGKYLQKYMVKESGLSRLKTHRIIARFAQRDIVSVKKFGNTNEVVLSEWVKS